MIKKIISILLIVSHVMVALPISKQATEIETSSGSEVIIESVGIFHATKKWGAKRQVKKIGVDYASLDARKAAIYFVLLGGTDPLLKSKEEKEKFNQIQVQFFQDQIITEFIAYEDAYPKKTILFNNNKSVKVIKDIKVNREKLLKYLEQKKIRLPRQKITQLVGHPVIMVVGKKAKESAAIDYAKTVIQSMLTEKKYEVVLGDQQQFLNQLASAEKTIKNQEEDLSYQLALSVGSDIYMDVDVQETEEGYDTKKIAVTLRAYESTTGRLIGSETGYSKARQGSQFVSIEEALLGTINNVLLRINNYWEEDLKKGLQYKVIFTFVTQFDEELREEIVDVLLNDMEKISTKTKENILTSKTMDLSVWCDARTYNKPRKLYKKIQGVFRKNNQDASLKLENQNRKLLQISIHANQF